MGRNDGGAARQNGARDRLSAARVSVSKHSTFTIKHLTFLSFLTLAGCPMTTWTHPTKQRADYEIDHEDCEEEARLAGPMVSESVFEHCMEDRGYRRAD